MILLGLCGLATIEPAASEAVITSVSLGGIGCTLWAIWQFMQYDR